MDENKFTVKDVSGVEKSKVEVEEQLLKEHEEKFKELKETLQGLFVQNLLVLVFELKSIIVPLIIFINF